jgi:hypothetical protein
MSRRKAGIRDCGHKRDNKRKKQETATDPRRNQLLQRWPVRKASID